MKILTNKKAADCPLTCFITIHHVQVNQLLFFRPFSKFLYQNESKCNQICRNKAFEYLLKNDLILGDA